MSTHDEMEKYAYNINFALHLAYISVGKALEELSLRVTPAS